MKGKKGRVGLGIVVALGVLWLWLKGKEGEAAPLLYTCPYCGASFATEGELDAHILIEHPEEPPEPLEYICPYCGAVFGSQGELDIHILNVHPVEPPEEPPVGNETLGGYVYSYYSYGAIHYLGGAEITLNGYTARSSGTYASYHFKNLTPGYYTIECSRFGYGAYTGSIQIVEGVDNYLAILLSK